VIKMRSYKKLINQDLLHLALLLTMLKVDPDSLGLRQRYGYDTGGGVMLGEAWAPHSSVPFMPLKGSTELIERYQEEIIEDLNTLGQFNRFSLYGNTPVQLSAYLVEADQCLGQDDPELDAHTDTDSGISDIENVGSPFSQNSGHPDSPGPQDAPLSPSSTEGGCHADCTELNNGICDVDHCSGEEEVTSLNQDETDGITEFEDAVRNLANEMVEGGSVAEAVGGGALQEFQDFYDMELMYEGEGTGAQQEYGPNIAEELAVAASIPDIDDHGAIQYELMHMDEQLMNIDYNIEDLDEAFLKMDEEIAKTFEEDDLMGSEDQDVLNNLFVPQDNSEGWQNSSPDYTNIPELLQLNSVLPESNIVSRSPDMLVEEANPTFDIGTLEAMDDSLNDFNLDMLDDGSGVEGDVLRNDVLLSHSSSGVGGSQVAGASSTFFNQVFIPETFVNPKSHEDDIKEEQESESEGNTSIEDALFHFDCQDKQEIKEEIKEESEDDIIEIKQEPEDSEEEEIVVVKEIVREKKKTKKVKEAKKSNAKVKSDLIAQVMKESGLDDLNLEGVDTEPEKVKEEKEDEIVMSDEEEVLHEELLDVVDAADFEQTLHDGAQQVDLSSMYSLQRKGLTSFSLSYQPYFNWEAFHNDHPYTDFKTHQGMGSDEAAATPDVTRSSIWRPDEQVEVAGSRRRREFSESSGYSSEDCRSTRDEKLAEKMGLPYTVYELINCPVERFNKIIMDKHLTQQQTKLCKDIRRRGKNKVAAQNCRKRKLETIEELQIQVESVRRRKEQLVKQRQQLEAERQRWSNKLERIEQFVLAGMGKDMREYTLQVVDDRVEVSTRVGGGGGDHSPRGRSRQ